MGNETESRELEIAAAPVELVRPCEPIQSRNNNMNTTAPTETVAHQTLFIEALAALFNKEGLSDIQLVVNKKLFLKAHKFILTVHSDVFKSLLDSKEVSKSEGQVLQLTEEEDCLTHFHDFVRYLYSGTVTLSAESSLPLYVLSEKYNVQELKESCQRFMLAHVATPGAVSRAITWHRHAKLKGLGQLEEECLRFIAWNISSVISSPDWTSLQAEQLAALLRRSDMVVEDEAVLFQALVRWLSQHPTYAKKMLPHIRYPMMSPEKVFDLQAPGNLPEVISSYLLQESLLVYQTRLLPRESIGRRHDISSAPFAMRLYTAGSFSQLCEITGFRAMGKTALSRSFSTTVFHLKTDWNITFSPKGHIITTVNQYNRSPQVTQEDDFSKLSVSLRCSDSSDKSHFHQLNVLLYRSVNGEWFVCDVKTIHVPHTGNGTINELVPLSERDRFVSDDTMRLHLVGLTIWEKHQAM